MAIAALTRGIFLFLFYGEFDAENLAELLRKLLVGDPGLFYLIGNST